jgi:hypothetical protein
MKDTGKFSVTTSNPDGIASHSPGLARGTRAYPGVPARSNIQLQRSCVRTGGCGGLPPKLALGGLRVPRDTTPTGLDAMAAPQPKVAAHAATSGFDTESRWDSRFHLNRYFNFQHQQ